jgi:hypothetical protein
LEVCLRRDCTSGKPVWDGLGEGRKWHSTLVDRNFNGLFSPEPKARARYMLARIVFIKTLWDISANLRARRFKEIMRGVTEEILADTRSK